MSISKSTPEPTLNPTEFYAPKRTKARAKISKHKISPFKLNENFQNEIKSDKEKINNEIFKDYFGYQNPSILAKKLYKAKQAENVQIVNKTIHAMINLRNATIKNEISKNKNPNKKIGIVEKIRDFNNQ